MKIGKGMVSETNRDIENPINAKRYEGDIYYVLERDVEINHVKAYDIYFTTKNEKVMNSIPFSTESSILRVNLKEKRFMEIREILSRRRSNAISQAVNRFGKVILLSSTKRRWEEVLSLYRQRDAVEKEFDNLKNDLDVMPLRVSKLSTLRGLLFIFFISLIIRSLLLQKARDAELLGKNSIDDILLDLAKLRAVKIGG
ncbi:MAG: transposase, partial [Methanotrichaceae archaeon]